MTILRKFFFHLTVRQIYVTCFFAGAVLSLGFAPFNLWAVASISFPALYMAMDAASSRRQMVLRAYCFGYGFFMAGTWWMAKALLVDAAQFGWLVPLCVLGLTGLYALWLALFGLMFWHLRRGRLLNDLLCFAVLWVIIEYLHSLGMFGFPWNLAGYVALASIRISQLASIVGIYGLSFFVVLLALLPVIYLRQGTTHIVRQRLLAAAVLSAIVAYGHGMLRVPEKVEVTPTRVRIVQANIPQAIKWTNEGRIESLEVHGRMSQLTNDADMPPLVIWPESAFPFTLYPDSPWPERLATVVPAGGALITGVTRGEETADVLSLWNSIVAINHEGKVVASYDKHQLVPFGEFVPLRDLLPMEKITPGAVDFSRGEGPRTLDVDGFPPFSPLVCYEAIFPGLAVDKSDRPQWLLNVTNDAWYGNSPGPYQHFAMSRLRAIEQGIPLVRAANTGISAVIDPYGRIVRMMPLNERGIIDQSLPRPVASTTWYVLFGQRLEGWLLMLGSAVMLILVTRRIFARGFVKKH